MQMWAISLFPEMSLSATCDQLFLQYYLLTHYDPHKMSHSRGEKLDRILIQLQGVGGRQGILR